MKESCRTTQELLGWGGELGPEQAEHVPNCHACSDFASELARVDAILAAEPVLPAPEGLSDVVMGRVADLRRAETLWVRAQVLSWAAASVLVGTLGFAFATPVLSQIETQGQALAQESEVSVGMVETVRELGFDLGVSIDAAIASTLTAAPSLPWMMVLSALPILLLINWSVARARPQVAE